MSDGESGMFTESLRAHLEGDEEVSRQTEYGRQRRIYSRLTEAVQKDMPLLLEALDEGRLDADDLVADLPAGGEGQKLFIQFAELLYVLAEATDSVAPEHVLESAFQRRRAETAEEVFQRLMDNPQSTLRHGELRLLTEAGFISEEARATAVYNDFPTNLTGEDLFEAVNEASSLE